MNETNMAGHLIFVTFAEEEMTRLLREEITILAKLNFSLETHTPTLQQLKSLAIINDRANLSAKRINIKWNFYNLKKKIDKRDFLKVSYVKFREQVRQSRPTWNIKLWNCIGCADVVATSLSSTWPTWRHFLRVFRDVTHLILKEEDEGSFQRTVGSRQTETMSLTFEYKKPSRIIYIYADGVQQDIATRTSNAGAAKHVDSIKSNHLSSLFRNLSFSRHSMSAI